MSDNLTLLGLIASGLTGANGPVQNPGFNSFQSGNLGGSLSVLGNLGAPAPSHNIPIGGDGPPMPVQQSRVTEPLRQKVDGSRTVFVGNLSDSVTDNTMFEIFGQCGELESIHWLNDKYAFPTPEKEAFILTVSSPFPLFF